MPNWCTNNMVIEGDAVQIAELAAKIIVPDEHSPEGLTFDFNGIHPMPEELDVEWGSESMIVLGFLSLPENLCLSEAKHSELSPWKLELLQEHLSPLADWSSLTVGKAKTLLQADAELQKKCRIDLQLGERLERNRVRYGYSNWHDWCVKEWGSKWNACECSITVDSNHIEVTFDTAWAPPEGVYRAICAAYPDLQLTVHYIEEGMFFAGTYENNGNTLIDYYCSDDEVRDFGTEHFGLEWTDEDDDEDVA